MTANGFTRHTEVQKTPNQMVLVEIEIEAANDRLEEEEETDVSTPTAPDEDSIEVQKTPNQMVLVEIEIEAANDSNDRLKQEEEQDQEQQETDDSTPTAPDEDSIEDSIEDSDGNTDDDSIEANPVEKFKHLVSSSPVDMRQVVYVSTPITEESVSVLIPKEEQPQLPQPLGYQILSGVHLGTRCRGNKHGTTGTCIEANVRPQQFSLEMRAVGFSRPKSKDKNQERVAGLEYNPEFNRNLTLAPSRTGLEYHQTLNPEDLWDDAVLDNRNHG
jgi:hypothetical protein